MSRNLIIPALVAVCLVGCAPSSDSGGGSSSPAPREQPAPGALDEVQLSSLVSRTQNMPPREFALRVWAKLGAAGITRREDIKRLVDPKVAIETQNGLYSLRRKY